MKLLIFLLSTLLLISCNDNNLTSSSLYLQFSNQATRTISVSVFPSDLRYSADTVWFIIEPGQIFTSQNFRSDEFLKQSDSFSSFNPEIYPIFNLDSAQVIFSDSLLVTHYSRVIPYDSLSSPSAPIYYHQPRNIFNFDNYSVEKINESGFKATYIFTENDVNYADSIHE